MVYIHSLDYFEVDQIQLEDERYFINLYTMKSENGFRRPFISILSKVEYNSSDPISFLRYLSSCNHTRENKYNSVIYNKCIHHLHSINPMHQYAQNLLIAQDSINTEYTPSDPIMILASPIYGYLGPIHKSRDYLLINGSLVILGKKMTSSKQIRHNPDVLEAIKSISVSPFYYFCGYNLDGQFSNIAINPTKKLVYVAVETNNGGFRYNDYIGSSFTTTIDNIKYRRYLEHSFILIPEIYTDLYRYGCTDITDIYVHPFYSISEGVIPITENTKQLFDKSKEKLFQLSDLPNGITKGPKGTSISI